MLSRYWIQAARDRFNFKEELLLASSHPPATLPQDMPDAGSAF